MKEISVYLLIFLFCCYETTYSARAATPKEFYPGKYAAFVIDTNNNKVIVQENSDRKRYPASLTKMMTLYLLFSALKKKQVSFETLMPVSKRAASQPPTKLGLKAGQKLSVKHAVESLITKSANDSAMVVAEYIGKNERNFVMMMNNTARRLGMRNTVFQNPSGLPNPKQYSTARDLATLAIALRRDFPQYYSFFSIKSFNYKGKIIYGHDNLLGRVKGVDGLKTGYINMSGYNLASSAYIDGKSIVAVIMGGKTATMRDNYMEKLINSSIKIASVKANVTNSTLIASLPQTTPLIPTKSIKTTLSDPRQSEAPILTSPKISTVTPTLLNKVASTRSPATADKIATASNNNSSSTSQATAENAQTYDLSSFIKRVQSNPDAIKPNNTSTTTIASKPQAASPSTSKPESSKPSISLVEQAKLTKLEETTKIKAPSFWAIQIGAVDKESEAIKLLNIAQHQAGDLLKSASAYTAALKIGNKTYYRARFLGFSSQQEANKACEQLKLSNFSCYSLYAEQPLQ